VADDSELAARLVRDAGTLAARMWRADVTVTRKTSVSDIVTAADHAAEEAIAECLHRERPADGIVGEEGTVRPGQRTWFVDPLDGTYNYAMGVPIWCSAVALIGSDGQNGATESATTTVLDADVLVGAIYHPAADELWVGGTGHPTTRNGTTVSRPVDRPLSDASVATYLHPTTLPDPTVRRPLAWAIRHAATVRTFGSGSIELAWVADGRLGAYVQHDCLPWDWLPGAGLVVAAGGVARVVEVDGHRWHVAGNRQTVEELVAALGG
jgi:myo-inositol-1(or 4)-monophosphatase